MTSTDNAPAADAMGKTKQIFKKSDSTRALVRSMRAITAGDGAKRDEFENKDVYATTTTCRVFELLRSCDIPVAYHAQVDATGFEAEWTDMIPLEIVARRVIGEKSSYRKRHPYIKAGHRFETLVVEFFLKTTKGGLKDALGSIVEGLDPSKGEEDPYIENPHDAEWRLFHPKKPTTDPEVSLHRTVGSARVLGPATVAEMESAMTKALTTLSSFFAVHDFKLIDFKVEFGVTPDGRVVISDVIDNDSWRLRDAQWRDVSKQSFRDGDSLASIENKYALVAELLDHHHA